MKIHAISTGAVSITQSWRLGQQDAYLPRLISTLFDTHKTEWLPIYTWVIEHPQGLIVIDTGIPTDANRKVYFPPFMPLVQRAAAFQLKAEEEIGFQIRTLGLSPDDVRWVVFTHLHQDHDGGIHHFPKSRFMVARKEYEAARGLKGRMAGYLNQRWPHWFEPQLIDFDVSAPKGFAGSYRLADDLLLVPTPGHSTGHLSVLAFEDHHAILFAGDSAYTEALLKAQQIDGIGPNAVTQRQTHQAILTFAQETPTVFLPSHDSQSAERLEKCQVIQFDTEES